MKSLMLIFIFAYAGSAYCGGSDTKPTFLFRAISEHEMNLIINNDIITGSFATIDGGSDTITKPTFRGLDSVKQSTPFIVNSMKLVGDSESSIFLQLNNSSITVEIKDSEIYKSQDFVDVLNGASQAPGWILTK